MLKAGFARLDVTPPLGTGLAGYFAPRYADKVLDPLELNAIALSDEKETILLIAFDALGMREAFCDEIRALIEERTGVAADHIILSCLHQHTSVVLRPKGGTCALMDEAYKSVLFRKFADVAQMALDDCREATLCKAMASVSEPLSFVRRYILKDGTVKTNPGKYTPDEIAGPAAEADNNVRLLRFKREEGNDIALVNFCTHPDVIGGHGISADWPGFVRRFVEAELAGASCILVNGFQGDTNHIDFMKKKEERFPRGSGYAHSEYMGRVIADTVHALWDKTKVQENTEIKAAMTTVYNETRGDGAEDYEICKPIYDEFMKTFKVPENAPIKDLAYLRRVVEMRSDPLFRRVPVTVLCVGDTVFFGLGGEPFTAYATAVREQMPRQFVVSVCCANGFEGYLPTKLAFEQGGYEATASAFTPNLEEDCVAAATALLKKIF